MSQLSAPVRQIERDVRQAVRKSSPFVERYARIGYAAHGTVYILLGVLAAMAAVGVRGGNLTGTRGMFQTLLSQPFGRILLAIIAAGLGGYALWLFIMAIEDADRCGSDARGIARRVGFFLTGCIHLALIFAAVRLIAGSSAAQADPSGDTNARGWTATLMSYPFGRVAVAGVGIGFLVYAVFKFYGACKTRLDRRLSLSALSPASRRIVGGVSRFGIAARGAVFGLVGWFLIAAAYHANPGQARGLGGAMRALEQQPYGFALLAAAAMGMIAFGVFEFIRARYRYIDPS